MYIIHKVTSWMFSKSSIVTIAIHKRAGSTNLHTCCVTCVQPLITMHGPNNGLTQHMISRWITAHCHWTCMCGNILTYVAIHKRAGNILYIWHNTSCWSDTYMASVHHASTKQWTNSTCGHVQVVPWLTAHCPCVYVCLYIIRMNQTCTYIILYTCEVQ